MCTLSAVLLYRSLYRCCTTLACLLLLLLLLLLLHVPSKNVKKRGGNKSFHQLNAHKLTTTTVGTSTGYHFRWKFKERDPQRNGGLYISAPLYVAATMIRTLNYCRHSSTKYGG